VRQKRVLFGVFIGASVTGGFIALWFLAATFACKKVEHDYPGISVGDMQIRWQRFVLHDVHIDRGWVRGFLPQVTVNWNRTDVLAEDGDIQVNLDKKPKGEGGETRRHIEARNMTVAFKGHGFSGLASKVFYNGHQVAFASARLHNDRITANLETTEVDLPKLLFRISDMGLAVKNLPHITGETAFDLSGVEGSVKEGWVKVKHMQGLPEISGWNTFVSLDGISVSHTDDGRFANPNAKPGEAGTLQVLIEDATVTHPWISSKPVTFHYVTSTFPDDGIPTHIEILSPIGKEADSFVWVDIDPATYHLAGTSACQAWADVLPDGLRDGPLKTPEFHGNLGFAVSFKPKPALKLDDTCHSTCNAPEIKALRSEFTYTAYHPNGTPFERTTGPKHEEWIRLAGISPDVMLAVTSLEDPGFVRHRGFIPMAFELSFIEDLRKGKFSRGGSTITMQLAKNLWLRREKSVGRKVEELLLASVLESCFTKNEILEIYLNVVEFGLDQYGIGPASKLFFDASPMQLNSAQAFYLAALLPNPKKAVLHPDPMTMKHMANVMQMLVSQGRLPDDMMLTVTAPDTNGWEQ
jgi:hypothetical protein